MPSKIVILQGNVCWAPELFRRIRLKDPLKQKQLLKGLVQLSEEGPITLPYRVQQIVVFPSAPN